MPRASNGTYNPPSGIRVNTGDTILTSQYNPFVDDVTQALTNSLDRNGTGGMLAPLRMGGNRVVNVASGVDPTDAATIAQLNAAASVPIGAVIDFWGTNVPDGYLFAAGQEVSRSTYAALFAEIGTNAGAGNGSTTFNLPDYRGRTGVGRDNMGGSAANRVTSGGSGINGADLGASGGAQTHTLTQGQMPSHGHTVNDPGHTHTYAGTNTSNRPSGTSVSIPELIGAGNVNTGSRTTGITLSNTGSGQPHNNMQPSIICNKIIRFA